MHSTIFQWDIIPINNKNFVTEDNITNSNNYGPFHIEYCNQLSEL
jgi:hypothetical protein